MNKEDIERLIDDFETKRAQVMLASLNEENMHKIAINRGQRLAFEYCLEQLRRLQQ